MANDVRDEREMSPERKSICGRCRRHCDVCWQTSPDWLNRSRLGRDSCMEGERKTEGTLPIKSREGGIAIDRSTSLSRSVCLRECLCSLCLYVGWHASFSDPL